MWWSSAANILAIVLSQIPFGGGIKFRLGSRVNLNVEMVARTYSNEWNESDFNFGQSLRGYSSLSLHYNFGLKKEAYHASRIYASGRADEDGQNNKVQPLVDQYAQKQKPRAQVLKFDSLKSALTLDTLALLPVDSLSWRQGYDDSLMGNFSGKSKDSAVRAAMLQRYGHILKVRTLADSLNYSLLDSSITSIDSTLPDESEAVFIPHPKTSVIEDTNGIAGVNSSKYLKRQDSILARLEFEIKKQRLLNELAIVKKAGKDTAANTLDLENRQLRDQLNTSESYNSLEQRVSALENRSSPETGYIQQPVNNFPERNSYDANGAAQVGAQVASSAKVDKLQRLAEKVDSLQKELAVYQRSQNTPLTNKMVAGVAPTTVDSDSRQRRVADTTSVSTDTIKETDQYNRGVRRELDSLRLQLLMLARKIDSQALHPTIIKSVAPPAEEKPSAFFATSGRVEVFFETSSYRLSTDSKKKLDDMIAFARANPEATFLIKGYTDRTGSVSFNRSLSSKRAQAVTDYLKTNGVLKDRLKVVSLGPDQSLSNGSQSYGRRVEVLLN